MLTDEKMFSGHIMKTTQALWNRTHRRKAEAGYFAQRNVGYERQKRDPTQNFQVVGLSMRYFHEYVV